MKKVLIWVPLVALVGLGYYSLRNVRMQYKFTRGETAKVGRGDLTIPINATGEVQPRSRREIKAEASGEVEAVPVKAGDVVKEGVLLIRLKPDDEERSVQRAEQDRDRAETNLRRAKITLEQRSTSGLAASNARLEQLNARLPQAKANYKHKEGLYKESDSPQLEYLTVKAEYESLLAQIKQGEADVEDAKMAIRLANEDVASAETAVQTAETTLGDAQKRLVKTKITSPADGMIVQVYVKEGEVIQGGKTTFTGGTVLAVLADWSECYVRAEVDEADIGVVKELSPESARPGGNEANTNGAAPITAHSKVKITVEAFPDQQFEGVIERIYPEAKKQASVTTYLVDIVVTSDNRGRLMSSMQGDVEFTAKSVYDAVLVPHDAVKRDPNNEMGVYVPPDASQGEDAEPKFIKCRLGLDNGMFAQILEGLKEGDVVYTTLPQKTEKEREDEEARK